MRVQYSGFRDDILSRMTTLEADASSVSGKPHYLIYVPALLPDALTKEDARVLLTSHVMAPAATKSKGNSAEASKAKKKAKESESASDSLSVIEDVFLVNLPPLLHRLETCMERDASLVAQYLSEVALPAAKASLKANATPSSEDESFNKRQAADAVINASKRIASMIHLQQPENSNVHEYATASSTENCESSNCEAALLGHFRSKSDRFALSAVAKAARSVLPRLMHHFDECLCGSATRSADGGFSVDSSSVESLIAPFIDRERLIAALSEWCADLADHSSSECIEGSDLHAEDTPSLYQDGSQHHFIPDTPLRAIKEALLQLLGSTKKGNKSTGHAWYTSLYLGRTSTALNGIAESLLGGEDASISREVDQALRVEAFGTMWTELQLIAKGLGALEGR
jgi:hypothetical protein